MWSFVTPLRLKRAHIFLSNYLEQGSPRIDGLHFCLTDGSPIKKIHQNQKVWKRQKKYDDDDLVISRRNKKKEKKWWTHKRQMNLWCNIIQRSLFQNTITSFWVFTIHICFHTLSLDHDTSIIKPTQIQNWLLVPFKKFNSWKSFWRAKRFVHNPKNGRKNKNWKIGFEICFQWFRQFLISLVNQLDKGHPPSLFHSHPFHGFHLHFLPYPLLSAQTCPTISYNCPTFFSKIQTRQLLHFTIHMTCHLSQDKAISP